MTKPASPHTRRQFFRRAAAGAAAFSLPALFQRRGLFADELSLTPPQMEGPFYPVDLPLDTDNDLVVLNDNLTPAVGEITHLSGRVLDRRGAPIRNALVEIWQVDHHGAYLHKGSDNGARRDTGFQGFGRFLTGSSGEYYFRTIKPVPYPGRTPHIHFAIKMKGREKWTTQCYVKGEPGNEKDVLYKAITDAKARESLTVEFAPIKASRVGEVAARFDLVLGFTPSDARSARL